MLGRVALLAIACAGCKSHWTAEITQPMIPLYADKSARTSWPLSIVLGDMEARAGQLRNTAYYVVVSRDRLRFHLTLQHKWESMSDIRTWDAWVEDGHGTRHPILDVSSHSVLIDAFMPTDRIDYRNNKYIKFPVYYGTADFTIYSRDLYDDGGNQLTLVLRRPGYEYRYVWHSEAPDPEDQL